MNIYHLECSVNNNEDSLTRKHSRMIVNKIKEKNPEATVTYVDLMKAEIPFIDKVYETAMFKPENKRTNEEKEALKIFDIDSFVNADVYVLGIPGYLFNVPARVKNWMEHLFRIDSTVSQEWTGMLPSNRKVYVVSAWGSVFSNTSIDHCFDIFLRKSFDMFGLTNIKFYNTFKDEATEIDNIRAIEKAIENDLG